MLGAIIGDIVGSRWEFDPTNDYNFPLFSYENSFTDDTICTIAVADALLHASTGSAQVKIDYGKFIHKWCRKYPHPMGGYGGRFAQWVASEDPKPYNSFGNGAAMRLSPVAHWFDNQIQVLDAAAATARPSHNHEEGIKGAQTVALAIFKAMEFNRCTYQGAASHIDEIIDECVKFSGYNIHMPKASVLNRFDETCQGTVPVALKIISMSTCFEDAVRLAVSLGADADTLGAIVGSIAEAIWGIPMDIRNSVESYLPEEMLSIIDKFYHERPHSYKPLIDTTFSEIELNDAEWDLLEEEELEELQDLVVAKKKAVIKKMLKRAKAREQW